MSQGFRWTMVIAAIVGAFDTAWGLGGEKVARPQVVQGGVSKPGYSPTTSLRVTVDNRWFNSGGYRPIEVHVESAKPAKTDTVVEVDFTLNGFDSRASRTQVHSKLILLKGSKEARKLVSCPATASLYHLNWRIAVDGVVDQTLAGSSGGSVNSSEPMLRFVSPASNGNRRELTAAFPQDGKPADILQASKRVQCPWFENWIDYSSADVVTTTLKKLQNTSKKNPQAIVALRRWVLAGGALWIEECGTGRKSLGQIDELFSIANWSLAEHDFPAVPEVSDQNANTTVGSPRGRRILEAIDEAPGWGRIKVIPPMASGAAPPRRVMDSDGWFAMRPTGFGQVLAFESAANKVPKNLRFGQAETFRRGWGQRNWITRHGVDPAAGSTEFGNLMIPGVGVAPVGLFQVLITLFVLAVGPLNYWLLWRKRQLQLLALTAPGGAIAVTLLLLAYATFADGFGVKARVRSVAILDQPSGEGVSWSRVTHYVGSSPRELPKMPGDAAVYPIAPALDSALTSTSIRRVLTWEGDEQLLNSGWVPSRTTVQHLVIQSTATEVGLLFRQAKEQSPPEVTNNLGAEATLLLVCDESGEWSIADELAPGESALLQPIPQVKALERLRSLARDYDPEFPVGAGKGVEETLRMFGQRNVVSRMQRNGGRGVLDRNLAEQLLDRLIGLDSGPGLALPPRSYVAVSPTAVFTPLGWDSVREIGSFHLIVGRW